MKILKILILLGCMTSSLQTYASADEIDENLRESIKDFNQQFGYMFGPIESEDSEFFESYLERKNIIGLDPLLFALTHIEFWDLAEFFIKKKANLQTENKIIFTNPVATFLNKCRLEKDISSLIDPIKRILTLFANRGISLQDELNIYKKENTSKKGKLYAKKFFTQIETIITEIERINETKGAIDETYVGPELPNHGLTQLSQPCNSSNSNLSSSSSSHLSFSSTTPQSFISGSEI